MQNVKRNPGNETVCSTQNPEFREKTKSRQRNETVKGDGRKREQRIYRMATQVRNVQAGVEKRTVKRTIAERTVPIVAYGRQTRNSYPNERNDAEKR